MSESHIVSALLLLLLLVLPCSNSARLLLDDFPAAAATHLELPTDDELRLSPEKHSGGALPCHMELNDNNKFPESHRLPGKYRALYLNHILPKGTTPPSGPSKGINAVNN